MVTQLRPLFVKEEDYIVEEGTHAEEMYFPTRGSANAMKHGKCVCVLEPGQYFGEVGCILSDIRHASVVARTDCELYTLLKADLFEIMHDYPDFGKELKKKANERLSMDVKRRPSEVVTLKQNLRHSATVRYKATRVDPEAMTQSIKLLNLRFDHFEKTLLEALTKLEDQR